MKKRILVIVSGLLAAGWILAVEHPEHPKAKASAVATEMPQGSGILDGKMFAGEIGEKGQQKGDKDGLIFKHGTFLSTACEGYGFKAAPYVATEKDGVFSFTVEGKNAKGEKMSWKGTVKNDEVEATAIYTTKGGWFKKAHHIEYWYKGKATTEMPTATEHPKKSEHPEHPKK